jgi:hypothetical protein
VEPVTIALLAFLSIIAARAEDPSPGFFHSKEESRTLECVRMSQAEVYEREPARVPEPPPRGARTPSDVLVCKRRYLAPDERPARDEAILSNLRGEVSAIVQAAAAAGDPSTIWHVDAYYPGAIVAQKIAVATRTELAERGHKVSDRVPVLAAGDLSVLGRMDPWEQYPLACARTFAEGALVTPEAFLGVMIIDAREGQLHAGVCKEGQWRWLR